MTPRNKRRPSRVRQTVWFSKEENSGEWMVLKSRADLIKKPTPPPRLFSLLVWTREKSSGVNSFKNEGVSRALIWVSVRPKTSKFPVWISSQRIGPLFLMDRQLANPNFNGPGFRATSPDNRTRASCLKDAFSQKVTLCVWHKWTKWIW